MSTKELVTKAIEAVQKHIDNVIHGYGTAGVPVLVGQQQQDYDSIIKAFAVRDLLFNELSSLQKTQCEAS
jgi:hypothetical protein